MTLPHAVYRDICRNVDRRASVGDVISNLLWSRGVQEVLLYRIARWCHRDSLPSGGPSRPDGSPVVEDGVLVGAGAKILGPVTIGTGNTEGANSVVTTSVPPGGVAVGMPARATETAGHGRPVSSDSCTQAPSGDHRSGSSDRCQVAKGDQSR